MDAIAVLEKDHKAVEALFKQFERSGDSARSGKKKIVEKIIRELSIHAAVEEQLFYPAVRNAADQEKGRVASETREKVLESLEEHSIVKWALDALEKMDPDEERYDAKVHVLIRNVREHVAEERGELFPAVRKLADAERLRELGKLLEQAKRVAPTHPHPRAPDTPPFNVIAGSIAAVADRGRDLIKSLAARASQGRRGRRGAARPLHS